MPSIVKANVTPELLTWAREDSGYSKERVAKRLGVKRDRVDEWESGERKPTLKQARDLAKFLHRPLNLFFRQSPPRLTPLGAQYRKLPGVEPGKESPELRWALRHMANRREIALELSDELGDPPVEFRLSAHLNETAEEVADRLREGLGVSFEEQLGWRDEYNAYRSWRDAAESLGTLVFQYPSVDLKEARGVSLLRYPLPIIGINSKETVPASKSYTLIHELVHLLLGVNKEEQPALNATYSEKRNSQIERFAEEVAAKTILPEILLSEVVSSLGRRASQEWSIPEVRKIARKVKLTPLAIATRLRSSGYMSWPEYNSWKEEWQSYLKTLKPKSGGFALPPEKALGRCGMAYTQLVVEALSRNSITPVDASRYMDLKFEHFEKLQKGLQSPQLT